MTEDLTGPAKHIQNFFRETAVYGRAIMALGVVIWAAYNVGPTTGLIAVICTTVIILVLLGYLGWGAYKDYKASKRVEAWFAEQKEKHPEMYKDFKE